MTDNEIKLIQMIRESEKPEEALLTAVGIITSFLEQERSSQGQVPSCPPGHS